ncbi:MAG: hypothetical protein ABWY82_16490, partial [Tardiphaga sp.]
MTKTSAIRRSPINALFNACCYSLGEDCGSRRPVEYLWRKRRVGEKMAVDLSMPVLVVDDYSTMI